MFTVIWLVVFTVGLPVQLWLVYSADNIPSTFFIALILFIASSYISSIVAVVWVSIIKRKRFLEIIDNISEVDNKLRYTLQEETYMNRKVVINIISEVALLAVIQCIVFIYITYKFRGDGYLIVILRPISIISGYLCNTLLLYQFVTLVFMVKQRYSHINKRLCNWINGTVESPKGLNTENERCSQTHMTVDHVNMTHFFVSSVGNIERTLKHTDIHLLRQICSELYGVTCVINDTYGVPILTSIFWILTIVLCFSYNAMVDFKAWGFVDVVYVITCLVMVFKITFVCHSASNEARSSRIVVQKLLLLGHCRKECTKELKMFSLQLQAMKFEFTACGFFSLNLSFFTTVVSVIASYFIIMVQIK
jgi:hypothetical protein